MLPLRVHNLRAVFDRPSIEDLVAITLLGKIGEWPLEAHRHQLYQYFEIRATPKGLHAPRVFDATMRLGIAERYREVGDFVQVRSMVSKAMESHPGNAALLGLARVLGEDMPITWRFYCSGAGSDVLTERPLTML